MYCQAAHELTIRSVSAEAGRITRASGYVNGHPVWTNDDPGTVVYNTPKNTHGRNKLQMGALLLQRLPSRTHPINPPVPSPEYRVNRGMKLGHVAANCVVYGA